MNFMKSILFILPYWGNFPNYFQLWLNSCKFNETIDWLIVTDINLSQRYSVPKNVKVEYMSFNSLQKKAKDKYSIAPLYPYDLCKYRVVYHELFEEFCIGYDFWGFCDCDLIWGNLRSFITDEVLNSFDKISWRGHMTLFKNIDRVNQAYKNEFEGFKTFRGCINNTEGINLFDEVGINKIFDKLGYSIYKKIPFADLKIRQFNFICLHNIFPENTNFNQIFHWSIKDGLERIYIDHGGVKREQIAYVHFLKRPMKVCIKGIENSYLIVPNKFIPDQELSINSVFCLSKDKIYWNYWISRLKWNFIKNKIKCLLTQQKYKPDIYN